MLSIYNYKFKDRYVFILIGIHYDIFRIKYILIRIHTSLKGSILVSTLHHNLRRFLYKRNSMHSTKLIIKKQFGNTCARSLAKYKNTRNIL